MKIVQTTLSYFAILGISSNQSLANVNFFMVQFIFFMTCCENWLYLIYEVKTFREYTYGLFFTFTFTTAAVCFTISAIKRQHAFNMIEYAEDLIEKRSENATKRAMYMETNQNVEKWSKLIFIFLTIVSPVCFVFPKAIFVYITHLILDLGNDGLVLPFDFWLPFDWKNPIGYAMAVLIEYIVAVYLFLIITSFMCAGLAGLWMTKTVTNDLEDYLIEINENGKLKKIHTKATVQITGFVQLHMLMIKILDELMAIIEYLGMVFFTWAMVVVCGVMLQVQWEISQPEIDFMGLMLTLAQVVYVFSGLCIVCEFGQLTTDEFTSIDDVIEQFHWYQYPKAMRKIFLTILPIVQKPVEMTCFGSIAANRKTFKKIVNRGYSYFTVLKNFTR